MPPQNLSTPWVALFDLDGTITWKDTLLPFLIGYLKKHPRRAAGLWHLPQALLNYSEHRDRGQLKSQLIQMTMRGEPRAAVSAWADEFAAGMRSRGRLRPTALAVIEAHRAAGDHLVLLSASPDLYVPSIARELNFERTLCTEVAWNGSLLDGRLASANRRGEEKTRCLAWLRAQYRQLPIIAYGNAASDLDHMRKADSALLVNGDSSARRRAQELQVAVGTWG